MAPNLHTIHQRGERGGAILRDTNCQDKFRYTSLPLEKRSSRGLRTLLRTDSCNSYTIGSKNF